MFRDGYILYNTTVFYILYNTTVSGPNKHSYRHLRNRKPGVNPTKVLKAFRQKYPENLIKYIQ